MADKVEKVGQSETTDDKALYSQSTTSDAKGGVWSAPGFSWAMFEFGRNPFFLLVVIFIFVPYFAAEVVGDPVKGQQAVSSYAKWAGVISAILAPIIGAMIDAGGRRKPFLAVCVGVIVLCSFSLWFVRPDGLGISILAAMVILVIAKSTYTFSDIPQNALLPMAGRPSALPYISGFGLGLGALSSIILFLFILWGIAIPARGISAPFIPAEPLFGLQAELFEPERFVGPLCAICMMIFTIPIFIFVPDAPGNNLRMGDLFKRVVDNLKDVISELKTHKEARKFLIARMIYADGVSVLLVLSGVYIKTFLGWSFEEMLIYAIWATLFTMIGGFLAGVVDRAVGPKRAIMVYIMLLTAIFIFQLSITREAILFGLIQAPEPVWNSLYFSHLSDLTMLGVIALVALCTVALISSSRYFMTELAPKDKMGKFFGIYAMVGTVTVWLGPLLVEFVTRITQDQRLGMGSTISLFLIGFILLSGVKAGGKAGG